MRRRAYAALLLAALLLVAGCANIPEESTPHAVRDDQQQPTEAVQQPPTPNLNAFDLVREFVRRSGNPDAARQYLTAKGQSAWKSEEKPTIIHDTFGTVPQQNQDQRQSGEDQGGVEDTRVTVILRVTELGRLGQDNAFIPSINENTYRVGVVRDKGQWRIDVPPDHVYVPLADFNISYRPVTLYFFDPDLRITVPDQRYVAAEPEEGLPTRVIAVLLSGPSDSMRSSVVSPLKGVGARTNVVPDSDGTLVVDLVPLGDKSEEQRELIAAQIVLTMQSVTYSRLRIKGDGQDLIQGHGDWRPGDIKQYDASTKPSPDQPGLVSSGGRLRTLLDGKSVPGPAGNGEYDVVSAAQSIDGGQLAVVTQVGDKLRLRVGAYGQPLQEINLDATTMTRPTWRVSTAEGQDASEVWTVEDGNVVRIVRAGDETWKSVEVNASSLDSFGPIRELRLSRDGTRAAIVTASGKLVVTAVVRDKDSVSLSLPRTLQPRMIISAVGVDWLNQHTLVVVTGQTDLPVLRLSVDGLMIDTFDSNNLQFPMHSVTAAPERDVVVTDNAAVLVAPGLGQVWRQLQNGQGSTAIPFYPG
ncbi:LpqB family beta-propeller domain-containing protein [Actinophytocola oryzae]|uniref:Sporulation and spore germination protein n=1 Tax=Actinophytocola oryzae TaxID=502181 RepID=A0A4V3FTS8_9PSEU|nr:LpqB family beta-propeller domain-containing protein [Actinophytocola oryzae]TDV52501.1 sporulation and spore germination protein [Actinophytocola oryzae]